MLFRRLIWIIIIFNEVIDNKSQDDEDLFIPTREWQVVKKGQKIPKGLHVRVNFETGITEAKLMDESEKNTKNSALLQVPQENEDEKLLDPDAVKEALKKIQNDDILKVDEIKKIKEKFRSYDELKEEMSTLNLTPKIDAEVLTDLFNQFESEMKTDKINVHIVLRILEDLDFLAHQFDNALEFVRQNGFKEIIYKNWNLSDSQIRQDTLKLFGSLVQNNGKVQIHALETGSINILLRILHLEQSDDVKSRAVYALSCLLRRFPLAQLRFIENGGISVVMEILKKDHAIKVQMKLVTLMNDLLIENIHALHDKTNENQNILISQYKLLNLETVLLEHGWCEYLNKVLHSLIAVDPDDHDSIEKCVLAMHTVAKKCVGQYNSDVLVTLKEKYKTLAVNDMRSNEELSSSDFFTNLHDTCLDILQKINVKTEL